jgi:hypothetical protein
VSRIIYITTVTLINLTYLTIHVQEPMMPRVAATLTLLLLALSTATCAPLAAVNLGAAEDFTVLAATGITNSVSPNDCLH